MSVSIRTSEDDAQYAAWIRSHPAGNLWQSLEYKKFQEALGRTVRIYVAEEEGMIVGSALVVIDTTTFGLSTWEVPRGPVGERKAEILEIIINDAEGDRCLALYYSPAHAVDGLAGKPSGRMMHGEATRMIDLTQSEEEILAQMKQKGRYNIRLAEKSDVQVEESEDIDAFYTLVVQTGERDAFGTLPKSHYQAFLDVLESSFLLLASKPETGEPVSGLLGVVWGSQALYYYGASNYAHRAFMAPYALQWAAMQFCKEKGCTTYDLLGVAPPDADGNHPWSGISQFKEKFGGEVVTYPPEKQVVLRPIMYGLLQLKRRLFH
ncbi:hypothetical protein COU76_00240 [Candidatus Peregrinibacteria bacterium CG10_big_fil_rev_8_21_14_0_10_49_10]|nr:MAG: hypothetical protein COU76_00240 [Candidatus Peregrinibacteria bacterium CG10_big_fil_rev_8_21_14_0_10_49_10]